MSNFEWFRKFENTTKGKRGPEYERIKEAIGKSMVDNLVEVCPQVKNHISYVDISSPLTMQHYLGVSYLTHII